jgi:hypothetical protein
MSRSSRFSKLEGERGGPDAPTSSGASLERFADEPELSARADPPDAMAPAQGAERLERFAADGSDGLGLDRDPLALLPTIQCVECGADCGKFEVNCHRCRGALTTASVRAHNLKRLEALHAERAAALDAQREKREQELIEAEQISRQLREAQSAMAGELHQKYSGQSPARGRWQRVAVAAGLILVGAFASGVGRAMALLLGAGVLLSLIPQRVWLRLGRAVRGKI